jgi:hypothetical protein
LAVVTEPAGAFALARASASRLLRNSSAASSLRRASISRRIMAVMAFLTAHLSFF